MTIFVCDDDAKMANTVCDYLKEYFIKKKFSLPHIEVFSSGEDMLRSDYVPDIAFLDIEMPGISGIFAGARLMRNNPFLKVIIVTSFPDYLDEAMKYHAYRYLSKPIDKNRMFRNLDDAIYLYTQEIKEVAVETKDGFYVLKNIDIIYLETSKRRALIHTVHGDYLSIEKLDYWENELGDASFCRSYRSFIVNMKYVTEFSHDLITLKYNDNEYKAYLNKRKYSEFKHKYLLYKESVR